MKTLTSLVAACSALLMIASCGGSDEPTTPPTVKPDSGLDGSSGAAGDGGIDGSKPSEGGSCTPKTCVQVGANCGTALDGCNGTLSCGTCAAGQTCGGAGPNQCGPGTCTTKTCAQLGASCGQALDGCSNIIDCGDCPAGMTCGAPGKPNECVADGGTGGSGPDGSTGEDAGEEADTAPPDAPEDAPVYVVGTPPGSVSRWFVQDSDAPAVVRNDFFGLHIDRNTGWPDYIDVPLPDFPYGLVRSLDHSATNQEVALQWARMETAPGVYDWSNFDTWVDDTVGKTRIFTLTGTPTFYQKYPGEEWRYPYLPGGASPPSDPNMAAEFVSALLNHRPGEIRYVEIWNEPNFYYGTDTDTSRWDPSATAQTGNSPFFSGTAQDLAQMARAVRSILPGGVSLMAGAWEGQDGASDANSMKRFSQASDGASGTGVSTVQAFSFHHYIYSNNPNALIDTVDGYRDRLNEYGYPTSIEFHCSEIGHEAPTPASSLSDDEVVHNIKRATYVAAALRVATLGWYKYSSDTTLKKPYANPAVKAALAESATIAGKTIRQAALLDDGRVWLRLSSNDEIVE